MNRHLECEHYVGVAGLGGIRPDETDLVQGAYPVGVNLNVAVVRSNIIHPSNVQYRKRETDRSDKR